MLALLQLRIRSKGTSLLKKIPKPCTLEEITPSTLWGAGPIADGRIGEVYGSLRFGVAQGYMDSSMLEGAGDLVSWL